MNVCRFYNKMNCLKDISIVKENNHSQQSSIYILDTCINEFKLFKYKKDDKIKLNKRFKIELDRLVSVKANSYGYLFALTNKPAQLHLISTDAKK